MWKAESGLEIYKYVKSLGLASNQVKDIFFKKLLIFLKKLIFVIVYNQQYYILCFIYFPFKNYQQKSCWTLESSQLQPNRSQNVLRTSNGGLGSIHKWPPGTKQHKVQRTNAPSLSSPANHGMASTDTKRYRKVSQQLDRLFLYLGNQQQNNQVCILSVLSKICIHSLLLYFHERSEFLIYKEIKKIKPVASSNKFRQYQGWFSNTTRPLGMYKQQSRGRAMSSYVT